jgi:hypothetical protein
VSEQSKTTHALDCTATDTTTTTTIAIIKIIYGKYLAIHLRSENLNGRDHSEYINLDESIILKCNLNRRDDLDWICLTRDTDQLLAVVSTKMDLLFP